MTWQNRVLYRTFVTCSPPLRYLLHSAAVALVMKFYSTSHGEQESNDMRYGRVLKFSSLSHYEISIPILLRTTIAGRLRDDFLIELERDATLSEQVIVVTRRDTLRHRSLHAVTTSEKHETEVIDSCLVFC